jgi:hypothetical protein
MLTIRACICAAFVFLVHSHSSAHATDLPVEGGPGGGPFRAECPSGQYLVGVSIKAGAWVDAIYLLCAPFIADQGGFGKWTRGPRHGGAGGSALLKDAACPRDRVVWGIKFGWTRTEYSYVDYVELQCMPTARDGPTNNVCVQTGGGCWNKNPNPPPATFPGGLNVIGDEPFKQNCDPKSEVATGIHGRSGAYVDALGLICGLEPTPHVAAPVPCPEGQFKYKGVCQVPPVHPESKTGEGGGFIQLKPSTAGGATITCTIDQAVDVCPTTEGCDENTRIGVLEAVGTVTVFERQGPWHKVKIPAGEGFVYSAEDFKSLNCPG